MNDENISHKGVTVLKVNIYLNLYYMFYVSRLLNVKC